MEILTRYTAVKREYPGEDYSDVESRTKQSFAAECDINTIMRRYVSTGVVPGNARVGRYGDFSNVGDYLEAQSVILEANQQFKALPANVRERFKNNPALMLEFVADKANVEEARKLGLLKEETPAPPVVEPVKAP